MLFFTMPLCGDNREKWGLCGAADFMKLAAGYVGLFRYSEEREIKILTLWRYLSPPAYKLYVACVFV